MGQVWKVLPAVLLVGVRCVCMSTLSALRAATK